MQLILTGSRGGVSDFMDFDLSCVMGYLVQGGCCMMFPYSTLVSKRAYYFDHTSTSRRSGGLVATQKQERLKKYLDRGLAIWRADLGKLPPDMWDLRVPGDSRCLCIGDIPQFQVQDKLPESPGSLHGLVQSCWALEATGWEKVRPPVESVLIGRRYGRNWTRTLDAMYDPYMSPEEFARF